MAYKHGVYIKEDETSVAAPILGTAGLQVIFGTAPINLVENPSAAVNKPILVNNYAEAVAAVGYSDDYEKYTLMQSIDASFKLFNVAPIVLVNVLDPSKHKATVAAADYTVNDGQATVNVKGLLLAALVVKVDNTTLEEGEHYTTSFDDDGYAVVTLTTAGKTVLGGNTSLNVAGTKIDPTAVTANDIIGGINASTGAESGLEVIRQVFPTLGYTPGLILAPGWSHIATVGAAIQAKCVEINDNFTCECVLDIPTTTGTATKYTDVKNIKDTYGYNSKHAILAWPKVLYGTKQMYFSAALAALIAYTDASNDDIPSRSPSNKLLGVTGSVLADGTEVVLDQPQANVLNGAGVVTALNFNGWRSWGDNTACYPENTDPKDRWINCRRMFSWQANSFILTYFNRVDDPANYRLIESIVDEENIRGNSLVAQGAVAGMRMEYNTDENPIEKIIEGTMVFHQYFAPYSPAQVIENTLEFSPAMLEAALSGESE